VKYLLSRAVRNAAYKVVLTGEGSDEILAGYPPLRRAILLYNSHGQDLVSIQQQLDELKPANPVARGLLVAYGEPPTLPSVHRALGFVPS
jgi:asparagine synthase (glutamine-hydrolysing)